MTLPPKFRLVQSISKKGASICPETIQMKPALNLFSSHTAIILSTLLLLTGISPGTAQTAPGNHFVDLQSAKPTPHAPTTASSSTG